MKLIHWSPLHYTDWHAAAFALEQGPLFCCYRNERQLYNDRFFNNNVAMSQSHSACLRACVVAQLVSQNVVLTRCRCAPPPCVYARTRTYAR